MRAAFVVSQPGSTALRAFNYSPYVEAFRSKRGKLESLLLGELLAEIGPNYGQVFTRRDCHPEYGVDLLSQGDMFCVEPTGRVIRKDSMPNPDRHKIEEWQLLIAGAGTLGATEMFGRTTLADKRLANKYVGPDAVSLTFRKPGCDLNAYVYAFLCTHIGIQAVRSTCYGTKVLRLRRDILSDLPIPIAESRIEERIASLVREAMELRESYLVDFSQARKIIEDFPDVAEAQIICDRSRQCVMWNGPLPTLSARNYASCGEALSFLRKKWKTRIVDIAEPKGIFYGPHFARIPCSPPNGVTLLSQRDVFMLRPIPRQIVRPSVADRLLFVPDHALLIAGHGQLNEGSLFGKVDIAECGMSKSAITQDILRIIPKDGESEVALAFLASDLGRRLLKSTAVGTSIPITRLDLVEALPFPDIGSDVRRQIVHHIRKAVGARRRADKLESEALALLESEVLPAWLT